MRTASVLKSFVYRQAAIEILASLILQPDYISTRFCAALLHGRYPWHTISCTLKELADLGYIERLKKGRAVLYKINQSGIDLVNLLSFHIHKLVQKQIANSPLAIK